MDSLRKYIGEEGKKGSQGNVHAECERKLTGKWIPYESEDAGVLTEE